MTGAPKRYTRDFLTVLVGGGVRSGKSRFALERARNLGTCRAFIATAEPHDAEMESRIARHKQDREDAFRTVESPLRVPEAIRELSEVDVVVVDCLTLWLSNLLASGASDAQILDRTEELVDAVVKAPFHTILVTNEVGMGVVPPTPLGRRFRDLAGSLHQVLASRSHEVYLAALGVVLQLRPAAATPTAIEVR